MSDRVVVVADTSPINYLVLINEIHLLSILFDLLFIPPAVAAELSAAETPAVVRGRMQHRPGWLEIRQLKQSPRPAVAKLDAGESEAIELALELGAPLLLMDEAEGRRAAQELQLPVRGTIGLLIQAADMGLVQLPVALDKLASTSFYLTPALRQLAMRAYNPKGTP